MDRADLKVLLIICVLWGFLQIFCTDEPHSDTDIVKSPIEDGASKRIELDLTNNSSSVVTNVLIYAKSRTGSTFTASLLQKIPGSFFSFEPLNMVDFKALHENGVWFVRQVLSCQFDVIYQECLKTGTKPHCDRWSSFAFCDYGDDLTKNICIRSNIIQKEAMCKETKLRSTKIVRMSYLKWLEPLWKDQTYKVIMLLRDPRAMLQSRFLYKQGVDVKDYPESMLQVAAKHSCREIVADLKYLKSIKGSMQTNLKILVVRYEDLVMDGLSELRRIHKFIGLNEPSSEVVKWLKDEQDRARGKTTMTHFSEGPRSVLRNNMTATAFNWKKKIPLKTVLTIQSAPLCQEALTLAGYKLITSQEQLDSMDNNVVSELML